MSVDWILARTQYVATAIETGPGGLAGPLANGCDRSQKSARCESLVLLIIATRSPVTAKGNTSPDAVGNLTAGALVQMGRDGCDTLPRIPRKQHWPAVDHRAFSRRRLFATQHNGQRLERFTEQPHLPPRC